LSQSKSYNMKLSLSEQYEFCPSHLFKDIEPALKIAYDTVEHLPIFHVYQDFTNAFNQEITPHLEPVWQRSLLFKCGNSNEKFAAAYSSPDNTVGIDLPSWLQPKQGFNGNYIMLLAEDPLRNRDYSQQNAELQIVIGSPFGLHTRICRQRKCSLIWKLVSGLMDQGFGVYLTDINKIWIKKNIAQGDRQKSSPPGHKEFIPFEIRQLFVRTLGEEIKLVNPLGIIAFGLPAKTALQEMHTAFPEINKRVINVPHSAARSNAWEARISAKATHANKIDFLMDEIKKKGWAVEYGTTSRTEHQSGIA